MSCRLIIFVILFLHSDVIFGRLLFSNVLISRIHHDNFLFPIDFGFNTRSKRLCDCFITCFNSEHQLINDIFDGSNRITVGSKNNDLFQYNPGKDANKFYINHSNKLIKIFGNNQIKNNVNESSKRSIKGLFHQGSINTTSGECENKKPGKIETQFSHGITDNADSVKNYTNVVSSVRSKSEKMNSPISQNIDLLNSRSGDIKIKLELYNEGAGNKRLPPDIPLVQENSTNNESNKIFEYLQDFSKLFSMKTLLENSDSSTEPTKLVDMFKKINPAIIDIEIKTEMSETTEPTSTSVTRNNKNQAFYIFKGFFRTTFWSRVNRTTADYKTTVGTTMKQITHFPKATRIITSQSLSEVTRPTLILENTGLLPYTYNQSIRDYVTYISERAAVMHNKYKISLWNQEANMTNYSHRQSMVTGLELIHFQRVLNKFLKPLAKNSISDPLIYRQVKLLFRPAISSLPDIKIAEFEEILFAMETIYTTAKVKKWNSPSTQFTLREITQTFSKSLTPAEMMYYWVEWRQSTGKKLKSLFEEYVELEDLTAVTNGFSDAGEMWTRDYETEDFIQLVGCHWEEIRPLYQELHAYVRGKLYKYYGEVALQCNNSPIPAHLTGDLWSKCWKNLYKITMPYTHANSSFQPDLKGFSKSKMIFQAERYFASLGFPPLPEGFWKSSILNLCTSDESSSSSAWDMHDSKDFRIKMCLESTFEDYVTLHRQLSQIQYYREFTNLSFPFRRAPNPAFDLGVSGAISLSVMSPTYLSKMGIMKTTNSKESDINFLLYVALNKIASLPYSYIVDLWRFRVFNREIEPQEYNKKWWKLRLQYQGIIPPLKRTSEDFDPGSEYCIATNKPYLQNYISTILEFQFFEALCKKSGRYHEKMPLFKCDLHNSAAAGTPLRNVMQMGASHHWRVAMKALTNSRQINSRALLEYFAPLYEWLKIQNVRMGQRVGWSDYLDYTLT